MHAQILILPVFFSITRNYDDYTICQMLSENLDDYTKESVPVHQAKFEAMMKKLNINMKPASIRPPEISKDILASTKCEGVCKNDSLLNEFDKFFNSMKKKPTLPLPSTSRAPANITPPKPFNHATNEPVKISVDESSGDLVFETNFRRKRDTDRGVTNFNQQGTSSASSLSNSRATENRFSSDYSSNNSASVPIDNQPPFARNAFNPFSASKRKQEESGNNFFKKPAYLPRSEPPNDEQAPSVPKYGFKTAAEELTKQVWFSLYFRF